MVANHSESLVGIYEGLKLLSLSLVGSYSVKLEAERDMILSNKI